MSTQHSSISWDDTAFRADLTGWVVETKVRARAALATLGLAVQNRARALAPVDTGRLRSSIISSPGETALGPYVIIGTNVEYATYQEFGTRFMPPQPYLRPAFAEVVATIPTLIVSIIR